MTDQGSKEPPPSGSGRSDGAAASDDAWGAVGLMLSGVVVWGGAGALVGAWLDSTIPVMLGLLIGMTAALYLVWVRYGRA